MRIVPAPAAGRKLRAEGSLRLRASDAPGNGTMFAFTLQTRITTASEA